MNGNERSTSTSPNLAPQHTEILHQYETGMTQAVTDYENDMKDIDVAHVRKLRDAVEQPEQLRMGLASTTKLVEVHLDIARDNVSDLCGGIYETVERSLTGDDRNTLYTAYKTAQTWGPEHVYVEQVLAGASGSTTYRLLKTALDGMVLENATKQAKLWGAEHVYVQQALAGASSDTARSAMKVTLDKMLFDAAQEKARLWGPGHAYVTDVISGASSVRSRQAIRDSLDSLVFDKAAEKAHIWGIDHSYVAAELNAASSNVAYDVLSRTIRIPDAPTRPRSAPVAERHRPTERELLIASIRQVVGSREGFGWFTNAPEEDIIRVINSVRAVRKKATDAGKTVSDSEIYLRYRRAVEMLPPDTENEMRKSFRVVDAMMDGNYKNSLPF